MSIPLTIGLLNRIEGEFFGPQTLLQLIWPILQFLVSIVLPGLFPVSVLMLIGPDAPPPASLLLKIEGFLDILRVILRGLSASD